MGVKWKRPTSAVVLHEGKFQKQLIKERPLVRIWLESSLGIFSPFTCTSDKTFSVTMVDVVMNIFRLIVVNRIFS